jgi:hypothetical protein
MHQCTNVCVRQPAVEVLGSMPRLPGLRVLVLELAVYFILSATIITF